MQQSSVSHGNQKTLCATQWRSLFCLSAEFLRRPWFVLKVSAAFFFSQTQEETRTKLNRTDTGYCHHPLCRQRKEDTVLSWIRNVKFMKVLALSLYRDFRFWLDVSCDEPGVCWWLHVCDIKSRVVQSWLKLLAPLVNLNKECWEDESALVIHFAFYS